MQKIKSIYQNQSMILPPPEIKQKKEYLKPSYYMFQCGIEFLSSGFEFIETEFNFMDIFAYNVEGQCCEIEVKVADYDLRKEAQRESKIFKHKTYQENISSGFCPNKFFFMIPENLIKNGLPFIELNFPKYGVIAYNHFKNEIRMIKEAEILHERNYLGELIDFKCKDRKHVFRGTI